MRFVLPGLTPKESTGLIWALSLGTVLFAVGAVMGYLFLVPNAMTFLLDYGSDVAQVHLGIGQYIRFCLACLVLTGLLFELPMVMLVLSQLNIVPPRVWRAQWRKVIVAVVVTAALITPTQDPITLSLIAGCLLGLYGLTLIPISLMSKK